ncbi:hypothetical protein [Ochrobactrum sp. A-1]|uniref:hypothetical protein n=1 Tax=Ochrobactrum sp. A-1 TaxID=2920940 RepID=UPI001F0A2ED7|nr:hypothetical protein [Ochrobactrum sp. A-1]
MMMHVWLARLYLFPPDNDCNNQLLTTVEKALAAISETKPARKMARSRAGKDVPIGFRQNSNRIFCFKTARKAASPRLNIDSGQGAETADQ